MCPKCPRCASEHPADCLQFDISMITKQQRASSQTYFVSL